MAKVTSVVVAYEATRKPAGDYTSDKAKIEWTVMLDEGEKASDVTSNALSKLKTIIIEKLKT